MSQQLFIYFIYLSGTPERQKYSHNTTSLLSVPLVLAGLFTAVEHVSQATDAGQVWLWLRAGLAL